MANKLYVIAETDIIFGSEVGDDVAWTSESISSGAGRQSAFYDLGVRTTASVGRFRLRGYTQAIATPSVGQAFYVYLKTSDGTHPDNDDGTGDAAVSTEDKLNNLSLALSIVVDEAAANIEYARRGVAHLFERYVAVVGWNDMGSATTADAAETKVVLTPMPDELQ